MTNLSTHNDLVIKDLLIETHEELLYIKATLGQCVLSEKETAGLQGLLTMITNNLYRTINMVNLETVQN